MYDAVSWTVIDNYSCVMLFSSIVPSNVTGQPFLGTSQLSTGKKQLSMVLLNELKSIIFKQLGNKSTTVSIVLGLAGPNGTTVIGYGNISKANTTKVNVDTIFDIASLTKTFTTTLLADMVKRGLVNLDDPIAMYLPASVKVPTYNGHKITLEELATHTSGLPDFPAGWIENHTYTTQQVYNFLSNTSLQSEPGLRYNYSNLGIGLLGYALALKAGVPYMQLVKDRILNVLGMDSTGTAMNSTGIINPLPDILKSRLAKGHIGGREVGLEFMPEAIQPAGALYSSTNDLLKYLSANMGLIQTKINDVIQDTHLIRHEQSHSHSTPNALFITYVGLGWAVTTDFGTEAIWYAGAIDGYESIVGFNPTKQVGIVILCSCDLTDIRPQVLIGFALPFLLNPFVR